MSDLNCKETRQRILNVISKHPNTKFAKLFHDVDNAPSQQNIVLLLMELSNSRDHYVDFNIQLQYFLNMYENLDAKCKTFLFNEAGLLVQNAAQIYSRRVDCVQLRVEDQLAALSSGQDNEKEISEANTTNTTPEKPKRQRKRLVEATHDPYEIVLSTRKFKKMNESNRVATGSLFDESKLPNHQLHIENYLHPALWKHAELLDLENEEEVDSKKNYRLFTSHIEHRYNTPLPDINFRLYFKMKDFMEDEQNEENEASSGHDWPSLSHAFVKRYIDLENQALGYEELKSSCNSKTLETHLSQSLNVRDSDIGLSFSTETESGIGSSLLTSSNISESATGTNANETSDLNEMETTVDTEVNTTSEESLVTDSIVGHIKDNAANSTLLKEDTMSNSIVEKEQSKSDEQIQNDSENMAKTVQENTALVSEENKAFNNIIQQTNEEELEKIQDINKNIGTVLSALTDRLSPQTDEGVCFSDTDDIPGTPLETFSIPEQKEPTEWPVKLNIFQFPTNVIKRMRRKQLLKHLGEEMENFLKARSYKRTRLVVPELTPRNFKFHPLNCNSLELDSESVYNTPPATPEPEADCVGFGDDGKYVLQTPDKVMRIDVSAKIGDHHNRLSRDSGVGNDLFTASTDKSSVFFSPITEEAPVLPIAVNDEENQEPPRIEILQNILIQSGTEKHISNVDTHVELSEDTHLRIQTWHRYLQPILAHSRERHHFDVFKIGTNIIDEFKKNQKPDDDDMDNSLTFQDVMNQHDATYVSRYFLSALLLANQGNLELKVKNKRDDKPSEWSDVHFKLISTKRHIVSVEDNIGMIPTKVVAPKRPLSTETKSKPLPTKSAKLKAHSKVKFSTPVLQRNESVSGAAIKKINFNLDQIKTITPIRKVSTKSDADSGIFSYDDLDVCV